MLPDLAQRIHDREACRIILFRIEPVRYRCCRFIENVAPVRFLSPADAHAVFRITGYRPYKMLAQKRNPECKYGLSFLCADQRSVDIQGDRRLIGINLDLCLLQSPVHIALSTEMDERFSLVPGRLVEVESVFPETSVKGHETLLILAVFASFVTSVRRKVEEIPHMGRP